MLQFVSQQWPQKNHACPLSLHCSRPRSLQGYSCKDTILKAQKTFSKITLPSNPTDSETLRFLVSSQNLKEPWVGPIVQGRGLPKVWTTWTTCRNKMAPASSPFSQENRHCCLSCFPDDLHPGAGSAGNESTTTHGHKKDQQKKC